MAEQTKRIDAEEIRAEIEKYRAYQDDLQDVDATKAFAFADSAANEWLPDLLDTNADLLAAAQYAEVELSVVDHMGRKVGRYEIARDALRTAIAKATGK